MKNINNSWKEKIDPALDSAVKSFVLFLRQPENLPNDGQLPIPDDLSKSINIDPNKSGIFKYSFNQEVFAYMRNQGLMDNGIHEILSILFLLSKMPKGQLLKLPLKTRIFASIVNILIIVIQTIFAKYFLKLLINKLKKITEQLPEKESKEYYAKKLHEFILNPNLKPPIDLSKVEHKNYAYTICSILLRIFFLNPTSTSRNRISFNTNVLVL